MAVQPGIRQGWPVSGPLYSLVTELFLGPRILIILLLLRLMQMMSSVIFFFLSQARGDIQSLQDNLSLNENASSVWVNWGKKWILARGNSGGIRQGPVSTEDLTGKKDRLKALGVYLDTEDCELWRKGARQCLNENGCFPRLSHRDKSSGFGRHQEIDFFWSWKAVGPGSSLLSHCGWRRTGTH